MSNRLLAIDIGNSHTTVGLFIGNHLTHSWRLATKTPRTEDELWVFLSHALRTAGEDALTGLKVAIASVVPALTRQYVTLARKRLNIEALVINHTHAKNLIVEYRPPSAVGADRICGAVAAFAKYGGPLIVADLGTATVFDVITQDGRYLGGAIAPGIATAVDALHSAAALLPAVDLAFPPSAIGTTTETAIQSGILFGGLDLIDGIVTRIEADLDASCVVVATGGFAELLKPYSRTIQHVEPNLVLDGIHLIAGW